MKTYANLYHAEFFLGLEKFRGKTARKIEKENFPEKRAMY